MRCLLVNSAISFGRSTAHIFLLALVLAVLAAPAAAQNGQANTNTATAVLHLRANVIPVAFSVVPSTAPVTGSVSFNIPSAPVFVEVSHQVRDLERPGAAKTPPAVLKTTVVLAR